MSTTAMALPASPTLTNPDMILPYGEYGTTPSPPHDPLRPESPVGPWKGLIPDDMSFSIGPPGRVKLGLGPVTPTTPIIYGNGTMLSDIGEVTEAESTPGRKPSKSQPRGVRGQDSPVRSSPTMGYDQNPPSKRRSVIHHRSVSMESDSTIRSEGPPADLFKDFDDGVSVDDSNFQGDDEESLMDESIDDDVEIAEAELVTRKESKLIETDDMHSSAALSRRAEMILANAKKRLDNMEGNLTRARSSLYITPSSSMSSIHSSSPLSRATPSPPGAERRIVAGLGVPPAKHRQTNQIVSPASAPGHIRVLSENSIPSSLQSPLRIVRSPASGLPSPIPTGGDDKHSKSSRYATPPTRSPSYYVAPLEPLDEDEITPPRHEDREIIRASTADPYSTPTTDHRVLTRSTSSMQMRDLTDKMKDLKGKISTLRDKAREENMKRRSLQSLRTPSPFTAAEQWYASSAEHKGGKRGANAGIALDPQDREPSEGETVDGGNGNLVDDLMREAPNHEEPEGPNAYNDAEDEEEHINGETEPAAVDYHIPASNSEQDDVYETAEEEEAALQYAEEEIEGDQYDDESVNREELEEPGEYQSESEVSLYHDTLAQPISHEDREDAFDYEHFFLHSAMGTINRERLARRGSRGSMDSDGSEDSVETAKGPEAAVFVVDENNVPIETPRGHIRNQKSTSTMASFVTATEGRRSSDVQEDEDEDAHDYAVQPESSTIDREQGPTPVIEKRSTFGKTTPTEGAEAQQYPSSPDLRPSSAILSTTSEPSPSHRPSIASFASTSSVGTARSFPLINKPKNPNRASSILNEAMSLNGREGSPVDMLASEDQILIERLVSSLGKCVLGLHEAGRASSEGRMWRRRMDAARRVLEGEEGAV